MKSLSSTWQRSGPTRRLFRAAAAASLVSVFLTMQGEDYVCRAQAAWLQATLPRQSAPGAVEQTSSDPQALFQQGEEALRAGQLEVAERAFHQVLQGNPNVAGAYANLGVIAMRRKQWKQALTMLRKAEQLAPQVAGIRLNIGLVYYRQNDFQKAIPLFEAVTRDLPDSTQARYLLGLCYFFNDRYSDAAKTLQPLWDQESNQFNYLYVLCIAANKANLPDLEQRALGRLTEIGEDNPEFHLLMGKAHINREEYDQAIAELQQAAKAAPNLPFVHFNLGMAYMRKQDLANAKSEFLRDVSLEPDVAYNYDQLGAIAYLQQDDAQAEKYLMQALRLDPKLTSSHYELARVYQRQSRFTLALREIDQANQQDPDSSAIHYLRGQVLQRLGRTQEAKAEMAEVTRISNTARSKRQQELYGGSLPNPEVMKEPE